MSESIDYQLRAVISCIMSPLKEHGKRRQRNPSWKNFMNICKYDVGDQSIDSTIVSMASDILSEGENAFAGE